MPFQQKTAWIMSIALLLGGAFYFGVVGSLSSGIGALPPPTVPLVAGYTVILVIIAVAGHIAVAVFTPKEANGSLDERERKIFDRAGHISGYVTATGVISSLGLYLFTYDGHLLFYGVFASMMVSQLVEYGVQIYLYRTSV